MTPVFCDGHVHFYPCYSPELFFDSVVRNFREARERLFPGPEVPPPVLLLTEGRAAGYFSRWRTSPDHPEGFPPGYAFEILPESCSLLLKKDGVPLCFVVRGRQIVAAENVEILHLGAPETIPDGRPARETLSRVLETGGIPVLAWGFGKWFFGRGRLIASLLEDFRDRASRIWLGDNSGRPVFWPFPRLFRKGELLGYRLMNGSDPLPFAGEERKPGGFGFVLEFGAGEFDPLHPFASIAALVGRPSARPVFFGARDSLFRFFSRQIRVYAQKYIGGRSVSGGR